MDSSKKVSFGFAKSSKLNKLVKPVEAEKPKVDFVDSFDGKFSFQGSIRNDDIKKPPLVIPLVGTKTAFDVIKAKLDERDGVDVANVKTEVETEIKISTNKNGKDVKPTLEDLAAKEILQGLNGDGKTNAASKDGFVIVPDMEKPTFAGEAESTLDDYENIPVDDFGLALLRGMGWTPNTGIGKEAQIVAPITSKLRPKRLGLGAEGSLLPPGDRPPLKRGVFVQILGGEYKNSVGVVEGTDGDTGSVFIKVAGAGVMSMSENWVKSVSKQEYEKLLSGEGKLEDIVKPEKKYGINEKNTSKSRQQSEDHVSKTNLNDQRSRRNSRSPNRRDRSRSKTKKTSREDNQRRKERSRSREHRKKGKKRRNRSSSGDSYVGKKDKKRRNRSSSDDAYVERKDKSTKKKRYSDEEDLRKKKRDRSHSEDSDSSADTRRKKQRSHSRDKISKKKKKEKRRSTSRDRKSRRSSSVEKIKKSKKSRRRSRDS